MDVFFFFNDTATTEIYTLSLHDALPISVARASCPNAFTTRSAPSVSCTTASAALSRFFRRRDWRRMRRSEEHTSELQSLAYLVCRLLLEKKKRDSGHHARSQ